MYTCLYNVVYSLCGKVNWHENSHCISIFYQICCWYLEAGGHTSHLRNDLLGNFNDKHNLCMVCHFPGRAFIPISTAVNFCKPASLNRTQSLSAVRNIQGILNFLWNAAVEEAAHLKLTRIYQGIIVIMLTPWLLLCTLGHVFLPICFPWNVPQPAMKGVRVCERQDNLAVLTAGVGTDTGALLTWSCLEAPLALLSALIWCVFHCT